MVKGQGIVPMKIPNGGVQYVCDLKENLLSLIQISGQHFEIEFDEAQVFDKGQEGPLQCCCKRLSL